MSDAASKPAFLLVQGTVTDLEGFKGLQRRVAADLPEVWQATTSP